MVLARLVHEVRQRAGRERDVWSELRDVHERSDERPELGPLIGSESWGRWSEGEALTVIGVGTGLQLRRPVRKRSSPILRMFLVMVTVMPSAVRTSLAERREVRVNVASDCHLVLLAYERMSST
jgi:hypothetical protein